MTNGQKLTESMKLTFHSTNRRLDHLKTR